MEDFVNCVKMAVYCVENDPVNIEKGEPKYLGFTFFVRRDEVNEMERFVRETLDIFEVPYDDVNIFGNIELPITMVWSKEKILRAIKAGKDYLISEEKKGIK